MPSLYTTIDLKIVSLARLNKEERHFLGTLMRRAKAGTSYLDFENLYMDPASPVFANSKRMRVPVEDTPLYKVCHDLATRLGLRQGFLIREEVVDRYAAEKRVREFTTGETAKLAGCTDEAVRKAIRTGRLRGRRVGRFSLIREDDAQAFAAERGKRGGRSP